MSQNLKTTTWKSSEIKVKQPLRRHVNIMKHFQVKSRVKLQKTQQTKLGYNPCSLSSVALQNFSAQVIHQPHLTGHINLFVLNLCTVSDAGNCFFPKQDPFLQEHNCYISIKGRNCMMKYSITRKQVIWRLCHYQLSFYP